MPRTWAMFGRPETTVPKCQVQDSQSQWSVPVSAFDDDGFGMCQGQRQVTATVAAHVLVDLWP